MLGIDLPASVFALALVFVRSGTIIMLLPGVGEIGVPVRVRLVLAFGVTLAIASVVGDDLPTMPDTPQALAWLIGGEVVIGLLFGAIARLMMSALVVAGQMAGMQTGLAFAQTFDPSQGRQGAILATFLNLVALALIFVTGLHRLFLTGIAGTYDIMPAGTYPDLGDAAALASQTVASSFRLGIQMSAPLIAFGLIFYLALGVLSRLMPQVQIFFVAMPANVLAGLAVFALSLGAMLDVWFRYIEAYAQGLN